MLTDMWSHTENHRLIICSEFKLHVIVHEISW